MRAFEKNDVNVMSPHSVVMFDLSLHVLWLWTAGMVL
jgi:hypothetical protein